MSRPLLDCVYIAASAHDARFTRICVASVRAFYPDIRIRILAGSPLERGLMEELRRYWTVELAGIPPADYGWGYVKLEPLFGEPGERFLVLDSDTVLAGPVLEHRAASEAAFIVDDEAQSEADIKRLYYDCEKLRRVAPELRPPQFVFNSGQWFGTSGVLSRQDFDLWLDWSTPPRLRHPDGFMPGDQGVLNLVLNNAAARGVRVDRRKMMRWPGHGMADLALSEVVAGRAPPLIIHWAGMKRARLAAMAGAQLLQHYERLYYSRLPGGERRLARSIRYATAPLVRKVVRRLASRLRADG